MSIEVFVGAPGEGKTYGALAAVEALHRKGWTPVANVPLNLPGSVFLPELGDLLDLPYGDGRKRVVLLDELGAWAPAREWKNLPTSSSIWAAQHRKVGIRVFATTQFPEGIDSQFRNLAGLWWRCRALPRPPGGIRPRGRETWTGWDDQPRNTRPEPRPVMFRYTAFRRADDLNTTDQYAKDRKVRTVYRWFRSSTAALYDTRHIVHAAAHLKAEDRDALDKMRRHAGAVGRGPAGVPDGDREPSPPPTESADPLLDVAPARP